MSHPAFRGALPPGFFVPFLLLAFVALPACEPGPDEASVADGALLVQGGWLFDGTGDDQVPNPGILVTGGTIAEIGVDDDSLPPDTRRLELEDDDTLVPGFFDLHAHYAVDLLGEGRIDDTTVYPTIFLANGVTSTFPAGEVNPEEMRALRLRIEAGEQVGPRLYNSGPYYGTWRSGWDQDITPDSIRAEVAYWVEQGAHGFKAKGISAYHLEALIEAAHEHGRTVTGHLDSGFRNSVNPRDAIEMGIDRVEHFVGGDAKPSTRSAYASLVEMTPDMPEFREQVERFIEHDVFYNATLSAYGYFGAQDPEFYEYFWPEMDVLSPWARERVEERLPRRVNEQFEQIFRVKMGLLERFHELGGGHLITVGTDHPSWGQFFSGFGVHREMHAMAASGIPPADVLRIASINGARALGVDDELGTIEVGKRADMVVVRGNPLDDIRATRNPPWVIKDGELYDAPALLESVRGRLDPRGPDEVADDRAVISVPADLPLDATVEGTPNAPGALQRALADARGPAILELEPGRHLLAPSEFVDPSCGNCGDPDETVPATLGTRVTGTDITIRGPHPDSAIIHTHAGYGILFDGCEGCSLEGVGVTGGERDPDDRATNAGVVVRDSRVHLTRCRIHDNLGDSATVAGVVVGIAGIAGREGGDFTVEECRIERNSWDGIAMYRGARAEIRNNVIDGIDAASGARMEGGRGVGVGLTWDAEAVVEGNLVRRYWKGIGAFVDARAEIRHNVVEEILTWGISLWASGDGGARARIEENVIFRTGACGAMIAASEAAGPDPGSFVRNAIVESGGNPSYDDGEPYCSQEPIAASGVPDGFTIAGNLLHENRAPGADSEPDQLDAQGFRQASQSLVETLRRSPAVDGSTFLAEWDGR